MPPTVASVAAGSASGSTQHAAQATAAVDAVIAVVIILGLFLRSRRDEVTSANAMSEVADSGAAVKVPRKPGPTRRQRRLERAQAGKDDRA